MQFAILSFALAATARAQYPEPLPGYDSPLVDHGAPPMMSFGSASFYSQDLGTPLRLRWSTESYGQESRGNFDIGTMQVITLDDSILFFDGQVTMNDRQGVGFNLGVGYRWLSFPPYSLEFGRVEGVSIWADGTSTEAGNFFPQVGLSYESLGELWDVRFNGYIPVGSRTQVGDFLPTGEIGFFEHSLGELTRAVVDTSFHAAEVEVARRLGSERDAWAFAGPYFLTNRDDDTAGWRAGLRGYAYPDLLLQVAVSDDNIFKTHATFSVIWFVGRTRTDYQPACGVPDRFREPVLRNDYVVLAQRAVHDGVPFTQPDATALRFIHVDSDAPPGGDGTFENPFNRLSLVDDPGNSRAGDIILAHAESTFTNDTIALLNNQRLLGEGDGIVHTVATRERGTIEIPETSPGARDLDRPIIVNALGDIITLANANEVRNFDIQGGTRAVVGTNFSGNQTIRDIDVTGLAAGGVALDLRNVASTSTVRVNEFHHDGGTAAVGGMFFSNFDGTLEVDNSSIVGGTLEGVRIVGGSGGTFDFAETVVFEDIGNTVFDVDTFSGQLFVGSGFENDTGFAVSLANIDGADAEVLFFGDIANTDQGIRVVNSNRALIIFAGDIALQTGANDAITLLNNSNANTDINFNGELDISTTSGRGFFAQNGGTLTASATTNSITTTAGTAVRITGSDISTLGVNFAEVNATAAGANNAILLQNNAGGPILLGALGDDPGESGVITGANAHAVVIDNSANVTLSGLRINNTNNNFTGVRVVKNTAGVQTVNLNDLEVNNGNVGVDVVGGAGTLNMTVNDTTINTPTTVGLRYDNVDVGTIEVNNTTIDGNDVTATAGILIRNSDATFTLNAGTTVREVVGTAFEVDGGAGNVTMSGNITNTAGDSVHIRNTNGGIVTMFGTVTDTGTGVTINNNSGGALINLAGTYNLTTGNSHAVEILNNAGADVSIGNMTINTTGGKGFTATGGGDLTVLGTNTINTQTGTGLEIVGMNILGQAAFQSVSVNGAANGIVLNNVTGAAVTVGSPTGAQDSGGTLNTTGNAIQITNVENAALNQVRIQNAGGDGIVLTHNALSNNSMNIEINDLNLLAAAGTGINVTAANNQTNENFNLRLINSEIESNVDINVTGSADFALLVEDTNITSGNEVAFSLQFSDNADNADVTLRGNNFIAGDASALFIGSSGATAKTINLLIEGSEFTNNSIAGASNIISAGNTLMNATIRGNTFRNNNAAGSDFDMTANGAQARIHLNLGGDDPGQFNVAAGVGEFNLFNNTGLTQNFRIFERDDTFAGARNTGTVVPHPNAAAFDDLPEPPPLPEEP